MTRVITFSTNRTYQPYVLSLLHSLEPYYNEVIVCRCVNCDDTFVNLLKGKGVEVIIDNRVLNQRKRIKNIHESQVLIDGQYNKNCMCTDETAYTCHSRFYNIDYIFKHYKNTAVFAIDCDFIIRKPFIDVFNVGDADISILDSIKCYDEDAIVIRDTTQGKEFLKQVIQQLEQNLYFWDQDTLALRYAFKNSQIKVTPLDLKYKDYTLDNDSCIWSGDGSVKYNDKFRQLYE